MTSRHAIKIRNHRFARTAWVGLAMAATTMLGAGALDGAIPMPNGFAGLKPVADAELANMRGGLRLPNGMVLAFRINFRTQVHAPNTSAVLFDSETEFTEQSLSGHRGVRNRVVVRAPSNTEITIHGTGDADVTVTAADGTNATFNDGGNTSLTVNGGAQVVVTPAAGDTLGTADADPVSAPATEVTVAAAGDPDVTVDVSPTDDFSGILNQIENNANGVVIQNRSSLSLDLSNVSQAIEATQMRNLGDRLRTMSVLGLY